MRPLPLPPDPPEREQMGNRAFKKKVVDDGIAHAARTMYEPIGFSYVRPKGQGNCVMELQVAPA